MGKIRNLVELPEWFNLQHYSLASKFSATDWLCCLELRRQLLIGNPDYPQKADLRARDRAAYLSEWQKKTPSSAEGVRSSPLSLPDIRKVLLINGLPGFSKLFFDSGLNYQPPTILDAAVRPVTEGDICRHLMVDRESEVRTFIQQNFQGSVSGEARGKDFKPSPRHPAIVINLNAKDADLKEAFQFWLKAERAKCPVKQPFYYRWAENQILPYLDLHIWEMETGIAIPEDQMEDVLFPAFAIDGGTSLKSTKTKARSALLELPSLKTLARKDA